MTIREEVEEILSRDDSDRQADFIMILIKQLLEDERKSIKDTVKTYLAAHPAAESSKSGEFDFATYDDGLADGNHTAAEELLAQLEKRNDDNS